MYFCIKSQENKSLNLSKYSLNFAVFFLTLQFQCQTWTDWVFIVHSFMGVILVAIDVSGEELCVLSVLLHENSLVCRQTHC